MNREERPFEPMLAATLKDPLKQLTWHGEVDWLGSVKLDGYRCVVKEGVALSRNLKPIRNRYIQSVLGKRALNGLDGALIVGAPTPQFEKDSVVARTSSGVTAVEGEPAFTFWAFDDFSRHAHDFRHRIGVVEDRVGDLGEAHLQFVPHHALDTPQALSDFERLSLAEGFEGVMLRSSSGAYKYGRATALEATLWKLKRFVDGEMLVLEILEGRNNTNPATENELGRVKRATFKDGVRPNGHVGTLIGRCLATGATLEVSPGNMTLEQRKDYWEHPEKLVRKIAKWRGFDYGNKDKLRFLTFVALREASDLPPPARGPAASG